MPMMRDAVVLMAFAGQSATGLPRLHMRPLVVRRRLSEEASFCAFEGEAGLWLQGLRRANSGLEVYR